VKFDESIKKASAEDVIFNKCLWDNGFKIMLSPELRIRHYYKTNTKDLIKQQFGFGFCRNLIMRKARDYPYDRDKNSYYLERFLTPVKLPFEKARYAHQKNLNAFHFAILAIIQQISYWCGFLMGFIFNRG
jgi:GT2 family glycosyltransferase